MKINYIPNRVIDADGIADGASIYVYYVGTTTPVPLYIDSNFSTPVGNPYILAAGAAVPPLYANVGSVRVKIVTATATEDYDPYDPLSIGPPSPITPEFFGAVGDGATDDLAAIQAALAYQDSKGGGIVQLRGVSYKIGTTIDNKYPRVILMGAGLEKSHDSGAPTGRTRIYAPFAGTSLKIRTPYAAEQGIAVGNTYQYVGAGCVGIMFDGGGIGTKAVEVDSVSLVNVDVYATGYVGSTVYEVKTGVTGTNLGEACDVTQSKLVFRARQIDTTAEKASNILTLSGSSNANVSLNCGPSYGIYVTAQHWNGHVLVGTSADNNDIAVRGYRPGGAGKLILGRGRTASIPTGFEQNNITFLSGQGASYMEGTADAGVILGATNSILSRDTANSTPAPTAGTGSLWVDKEGNGITTGAANSGLVISDATATAITERPLLGTASLRIRNASSNHQILTDGTNTWGFNLNGADLRINRLAGAGLISLQAAVAITGTVSASNLSGTNTGDQTITLTGDVAGSGTGSFAVTSKNRTLNSTFADAQNTTTTETDIFSFTTAAGELAANGDRIEAQYAGTFVSSATATRQLRVKFAGTTIFDSGALTLSLSSAWDVYVTLTRVSATVIRYAVSMTTQGAALAAYTACGELTGLTLSNTNILKLTGQAAGTGAATGDITGKISSVDKRAV